MISARRTASESIEAALAGAVLLAADIGQHRDLAGVDDHLGGVRVGLIDVVTVGHETHPLAASSLQFVEIAPRSTARGLPSP